MKYNVYNLKSLELFQINFESEIWKLVKVVHVSMGLPGEKALFITIKTLVPKDYISIVV